MQVAGIKIDIMTLARGTQRIHLVTCNICGPVAVDTTGDPERKVALDHLREAHHMGGVPA